jgi:biotin synthase
MIALTRIALPKSRIRLSAGRNKLSHEAQTLCFLAGANSVFLGEKLLTTENNCMEDDFQLFNALGLILHKN